MKGATEELNMTVIAVVAVAAVAALFYAFVWPMIQRSIADNTCQTYGEGFHAVKNTATGGGDAGTGASKTSKWVCCPKGVTSASDSSCVAAD
ncbi:MAG: hypothetical protein RSB41_00425 [Bacilli bacterium]